ncbi:MAG: hypothetical protein K2K45_11850 [Muribaculaceae bacterium]|nr:hypothetical protein [Muribaculaceae bacterium]
MNNRQTNSDTFLDACLFYGLPGIVILSVSMMASIKVGADFGGDGMVRTGTFLGCNLFLWLSYYTLFISLPESLMLCFGKRDKTVVTVDISEPTCIAEIQVSDESMIEAEPEKENEEPVEELPSTDDVSISEDPVAEPSVLPIVKLDYHAICLEYEQRRTVERTELIEDIIEYAGRTMAPFVSEKNMICLCEEIRCWCSNPQHEPSEICLRDRLSTNDLCHFIWNIGVRLGRNNGYSGECRAKFVKRMFALSLSEVELSSLKNMTKRTSADRIPLDEPAPGSLKFHYPKDDDSSVSMCLSA